MFEAVVAALFRTVLDEEVCADEPTDATVKKVLIASKPVNSAPGGESDADNLKAVGRPPHLPAPSMWN
ncbi:MAG: hypothetical protein JO141_16150 [Bradyrhizobium sp.]|nr:hypothetical protein [Bradyrhizobium sp.]